MDQNVALTDIDDPLMKFTFLLISQGEYSPVLLLHQQYIKPYFDYCNTIYKNKYHVEPLQAMRFIEMRLVQDYPAATLVYGFKSNDFDNVLSFVRRNIRLDELRAIKLLLTHPQFDINIITTLDLYDYDIKLVSMVMNYIPAAAKIIHCNPYRFENSLQLRTFLNYGAAADSLLLHLIWAEDPEFLDSKKFAQYLPICLEFGATFDPIYKDFMEIFYNLISHSDIEEIKNMFTILTDDGFNFFKEMGDKPLILEMKQYQIIYNEDATNVFEGIINVRNNWSIDRRLLETAQETELIDYLLSRPIDTYFHELPLEIVELIIREMLKITNLE